VRDRVDGVVVVGAGVVGLAAHARTRDAHPPFAVLDRMMKRPSNPCIIR